MDFKEGFDPDVRSEWPELVKDFVAMANSGGGLIVFGVRNNGTAAPGSVRSILALDPAVITDKVARYTGVRRVNDITETTHPQFAYEPKWGSPQYSPGFVDWVLEQFRRDRTFFETAKAEYGRRQQSR